MFSRVLSSIMQHHLSINMSIDLDFKCSPYIVVVYYEQNLNSKSNFRIRVSKLLHYYTIIRYTDYSVEIVIKGGYRNLKFHYLLLYVQFIHIASTLISVNREVNTLSSSTYLRMFIYYTSACKSI